MKKFLFFLLALASLGRSATDLRDEFLAAYYSADYDQAHKLVGTAFSDASTIQIWENRIHYYKDFPDCRELASAPPSARAMAHLRIGEIEKAASEFGNDRLSFLGLAILKTWQNDIAGAQQAIRSALALAPNDSETVFLAGNLASSDEDALQYFSKYLDLSPQDQLKVASATDAIDFLKKTKGMKLNIASLRENPAGFQTQYDRGYLTIRATINQKKVKLLLDTGASGLSLQNEEWQPKITSDLRMIGLGKKAVSRGKILVLDQFDSGPLSLENPVAAVAPSFQGHGYDGVVGSILFSDYAVLAPLKPGREFQLLPQTVDANDELQKQGFRFKEKTTLPFYQVNKMIILKGQINRSDKQMDFLLDTGAQQSVLSAATARRLAHINYHSTLYNQQQTNLRGLGGIVQPLLVVKSVDVRVGPLSKDFKKMSAVSLAEISEALELEVDMILGQDFLSGYTLLIDYSKNRVTFFR